MKAFGDLGDVAGPGDLGKLLGRRDRSRSALDPRGTSSYPPKKRGSFFKDLLEGFGDGFIAPRSEPASTGGGHPSCRAVDDHGMTPTSRGRT